MGIALTPVVLEIERHVADGGWDQPPRLFALAPTAELVAREPGLAAALGLSAGDEGVTPVEQEEFPADRPLDQVLATLAWPQEVTGCALVVERIVLPPEAEEAVAATGAEPDLAAAAAAHPGRQDVRMAVAVLRDGTRAAALRVRTHDHDDSVLTGENLVPRLADALAATLRD